MTTHPDKPAAIEGTRFERVTIADYLEMSWAEREDFKREISRRHVRSVYQCGEIGALYGPTIVIGRPRDPTPIRHNPKQS